MLLIHEAIGGFFNSINEIGAEIFDMAWIRAVIQLFNLFGWALFVVGTVVAVFDVTIEYQHGRANIRSCALNILKGFFACSLIGIVPIELYKFCISLPATLAQDLIGAYIQSERSNFAGLVVYVHENYMESVWGYGGVINLIELIAFGYCCVKIFFRT